MCKPWPADPQKRGHEGTRVGLGGPTLRKFRAQLLQGRGGCRGLSLDGAPARPGDWPLWDSLEP